MFNYSLGKMHFNFNFCLLVLWNCSIIDKNPEFLAYLDIHCLSLESSYWRIGQPAYWGIASLSGRKRLNLVLERFFPRFFQIEIVK